MSVQPDYKSLLEMTMRAPYIFVVKKGEPFQSKEKLSIKKESGEEASLDLPVEKYLVVEVLKGDVSGDSLKQMREKPISVFAHDYQIGLMNVAYPHKPNEPRPIRIMDSYKATGSSHDILFLFKVQEAKGAFFNYAAFDSWEVITAKDEVLKILSKKAAVEANKNESSPIQDREPQYLYYFRNFSSFHGDGEAIWVDPSGKTTVQLANRTYTFASANPLELFHKEISFKGKNCIFEFQLDEKLSKRIHTIIKENEYKDLKVKDRMGIPDEVRVHFGFTSDNGLSKNFEAWEKDLGLQSRELLSLIDLARPIINQATDNKPLSCDEIKNNNLELYRK